MRTYSLFIEDDRYSVPTLVVIEARSDDGAVAIAQRHLRESRHHQSVELCFEDRPLFKCRRAEVGTTCLDRPQI
jgi:hypothetical protein